MWTKLTARVDPYNPGCRYGADCKEKRRVSRGYENSPLVVVTTLVVGGWSDMALGVRCEALGA